jgi:hypothetical protein
MIAMTCPCGSGLQLGKAAPPELVTSMTRQWQRTHRNCPGVITHLAATANSDVRLSTDTEIAVGFAAPATDGSNKDRDRTNKGGTR